MDVLNTGKHRIKGIAWTGQGQIIKVEISTDSGKNWSAATLGNQDPNGYSWISWSFDWSVFEKGEYTILSKATDSNHRTQPSIPFWNRKGYGYNAIDKITVKIE